MIDHPLSDLEATQKVLDNSRKTQDEKGPDLRQVHAKSHGLMHGKFIVNDCIPDGMGVGVFAEPRKDYPIWVRFSNGLSPKERGEFHKDAEPDVRGMAIKLMGVEGEKLMDDEEGTQDFVLINSPRFFVRDAEGYLAFRAAAAKEQISETWQASANLTHQILGQIFAQNVGNSLHIQYWSTTPYRLGSHIIKFSLKPEELESPPESTTDRTENYLREAMVEYLTQNGKEAKFKFLVQLYIDDDKTPIEDPTKEWDSEFHEVATIVIPSQPFDFDERKRLDESLSFTPWHSLREHEPVGKVNLSRKEIYHHIAQRRRAYIEKRLREPKPHESVKDDPKP
jgi:catalase